MDTFINHIGSIMNHAIVIPIILIALFIFLALFLLTEIIMFFDALSSYFTTKAQCEKLEAERLKNPKYSPKDQIQISNQLIDIINFLIQAESRYVIQMYAALHTKYEPMNFDKDLKIVMKNVFKGLKKEFLLDENILFDKEWVMEYITKESTYYLLTFIQQYNDALRFPNNNGDTD